MENDQDIVTAFVHAPDRRLLLASHEGNGFVVPEAEVVANTRKGRQVMNVKAPDEAQRCVPVVGDHLAIVGDNRKMLVFPLSEIPEMTRGKGVRLQKYKDGGVLDLKTFAMAEGLTWQDSADRTFSRSQAELAECVERARDHRLGHPELLRQPAHRMRRQFEIDGEQDRGLAGRKIRLAVPHQIEMHLPPQPEGLRGPDLQGHTDELPDRYGSVSLSRRRAGAIAFADQP